MSEARGDLSSPLLPPRQSTAPRRGWLTPSEKRGPSRRKRLRLFCHIQAEMRAGGVDRRWTSGEGERSSLAALPQCGLRVQTQTKSKTSQSPAARRHSDRGGQGTHRGVVPLNRRRRGLPNSSPTTPTHQGMQAICTAASTPCGSPVPTPAFTHVAEGI